MVPKDEANLCFSNYFTIAKLKALVHPSIHSSIFKNVRAPTPTRMVEAMVLTTTCHLYFVYNAKHASMLNFKAKNDKYEICTT